MSRANKHRERSTISAPDPRFTRDNSNLVQIKPYSKQKTQVQIIPRNLSQESYLELLRNAKKYIVFAIGPAGTGKTMLAVQTAIKLYKEGSIEKIVITRPAVSADEEHGFLPGDLNAKMLPWTRPIMDVFEEYYTTKDITAMIEDGCIEIAPLGLMRGRTFKNAFIVADECQDTTPNQMKMLLTRIGDGSRLVVTGDLKQADRIGANGLLDFCKLFGTGEEYKTIGMAHFTAADVERHPVIKDILRIYGEDTAI